MAQIVSIDSQTRGVCAAIINAKCALIVALHRSAARPRLTRINKTKIATAKREVSAQRFRKQLLISLPLSRPVARLIMNAPRRRAAIKRQGFRILLLVFVAALTETVAVFIVQSDSKVVQQVCKNIDPRAVLRCDGLRSHMHDNSSDVSSTTDTQIRSCELSLRAASNNVPSSHIQLCFRIRKLKD